MANIWQPAAAASVIRYGLRVALRQALRCRRRGGGRPQVESSFAQTRSDFQLATVSLRCRPSMESMAFSLASVASIVRTVVGRLLACSHRHLVTGCASCSSPSPTAGARP
eukprot:209180-Alexandrium_andersonii.AAC.1